MGIYKTLEVISGKWKPLILCYLGHGPMRTGELQRSLGTISQKVLTEQLKELLDEGIIERISYPVVPPKVEYQLSHEGKSLRDILVSMSEWGETRIQALKKQGKTIDIIHSSHDGYLDIFYS
ncbi:winged helix-turn-helix transcriptional regulator [Streptococcus castoreus]|uniref:winged helix-turn-helix transcriptional regulator n=1 Tax=Streptococcus castoreus TaxID=254786 RepID=UPI0004174CF8|nr:helix-turn-helix domain-containing protein [Streptococcus castoreus]